MKQLLIAAATLLCLFFIALTSNYLGTDFRLGSDFYLNAAPVKDTINVIVAVDWTGSTRRIGTYGTSTYYRTQLQGIVKDHVESLINGIGRNHVLNISYSYFGLIQPANRYGSNPDFRHNYIKTFRANRSQFLASDWSALVDNLTSENIGKHTAKTVARQLSVVLTSSSRRLFDRTYLIFITDQFYNVPHREEISREMSELAAWSNDPSVLSYQEIKGISFALRTSQQYDELYQSHSLRTIELLPDNMSESESHYSVRLFQVSPKDKKYPGAFIRYPDHLEYECLNNETIRLRSNISLRDTEIENSRYTLQELLIAVYDSTNTRCLYRAVLPRNAMPGEFILPRFPQDAFDLRLIAYYHFDDDDFYGRHREKHEIIIPCRRSERVKICGLFPIQGNLLSAHDSLGFFRGQKKASTFWSFVFYSSLLLIVLAITMKIITPPAPEVRYTLIMESDKS